MFYTIIIYIIYTAGEKPFVCGICHKAHTSKVCIMCFMYQLDVNVYYYLFSQD